MMKMERNIVKDLENIIIPTPNRKIGELVKKHWLEFDPSHGLGDLEKMVVKYAALTGKLPVKELKTAMLLMCGDHGIAKYGVSAFPPEVTIQMIHGYLRGSAGANVMARHAKADIFITDVGVNADLADLSQVINCKVAMGTNDFTKGPAMTKKQAIAAIQAGMKVANECIDQGYNLLVTAEMGIGNTTSTAAMASAILGLVPELTVGRGSGINDERMAIKRGVVAEGLKINAPNPQDALDVLSKVGGYDHAGLAGMILAGAQRGVPSMVDGVNATAAALIAYGINPACAAYMFCSHLSEEISHGKMLEMLQLHPIVDAGMRLGEGTGASLAIVILQMALDVYNKAETEVYDA
jgi:nicotinate-nucleotide--dimethylbenzimidazole phosphoribosyltransferase